jgi:3-oxoacyl-(acyl-carrier-protein) synthase
MGLGGHNSTVIVRRYEDGVSHDPGRRAVVTGMGTVSPASATTCGPSESNTIAGVSGVATITGFDPSNGEVPHRRRVKGFEPRGRHGFQSRRAG